MQETTMPVSIELPPSTIAAILEVELEGGKEMEVGEEVEERRKWRWRWRWRWRRRWMCGGGGGGEGEGGGLSPPLKNLALIPI
jgi:hypothetical protein